LLLKPVLFPVRSFPINMKLMLQYNYSEDWIKLKAVLTKSTFLLSFFIRWQCKLAEPSLWWWWGNRTSRALLWSLLSCLFHGVEVPEMLVLPVGVPLVSPSSVRRLSSTKCV
jgi:hypothetical protein